MQWFLLPTGQKIKNQTHFSSVRVDAGVLLVLLRRLETQREKDKSRIDDRRHGDASWAERSPTFGRRIEKFSRSESEWAANDKKRERERESVEGGETIRLFPPHSASTLAVKIVMVMKRGYLVCGEWRKMQQLRTWGWGRWRWWRFDIVATKRTRTVRNPSSASSWRVRWVLMQQLFIEGLKIGALW